MNKLIGITLGLALAAGPASAIDLGLCEVFEEPLGRIAASCQQKVTHHRGVHVVEWNTLGLRPDRHGLMGEVGFGIDFDFDLDAGVPGAFVVASVKPTRPALDADGEPRAIDDGSQWVQVVVLSDGNVARLALRRYAEDTMGVEMTEEIEGPIVDVSRVRQHLSLSVELNAGLVSIRVDSAGPKAHEAVQVELVDFGELLPWIQLRSPLAPAGAAISNSDYSNPRGWSR